MLPQSWRRATALIALLASGALAERHYFLPDSISEYDTGAFGLYPEVHFNSTDLVSPQIMRRTWAPECDRPEEHDYYYMLAPYGFANPHPGPLILDYSGQMVWHHETVTHAYGFMAQEYKGEQVLTWWSGDDAVRGHGVGNYYMLDNTYGTPRKVGAANSYPADLHEFKITNEDTALVTSYVPVPRVLEDLGMPAKGYVWDGVFQEFDIESNELIFEWHALDHFGLDDCILDTTDGWGTQEHPWDWFHINSVDKDDKGNYLVSARYCAISYVSGQTGDVLWRLGGRNSSFTDLSEGSATSFMYQHHARWVDNYTAITMFDNQAATSYARGVPSRGLKVALDLEEMAATAVIELIHPTRWIGFSQGSMQTLDNGNYLLGYGHTGVFSEFRPDGEVACEIQYAPLRIGENNVFMGGAGQSYRVFKQKWVGNPKQDPKIKFDPEQRLAYVSWNGATKVAKWSLEASMDRKEWMKIGEARKSGFETVIDSKHHGWNVFRLTAYDKEDKPLNKWIVFRSGTIQSVSHHDAAKARVVSHNNTVYAVAAVASLIGGIVGALLACCCTRRRSVSRVMFRHLRTSGDFSSTSSLTASPTWKAQASPAYSDAEPDWEKASLTHSSHDV